MFLPRNQSFVMVDTEISLLLLEVFKLGHHFLPLNSQALLNDVEKLALFCL